MRSIQGIKKIPNIIFVTYPGPRMMLVSNRRRDLNAACGNQTTEEKDCGAFAQCLSLTAHKLLKKRVFGKKKNKLRETSEVGHKNVRLDPG